MTWSGSVQPALELAADRRSFGVRRAAVVRAWVGGAARRVVYRLGLSLPQRSGAGSGERLGVLVVGDVVVTAVGGELEEGVDEARGR